MARISRKKDTERKKLVSLTTGVLFVFGAALLLWAAFIIRSRDSVPRPFFNSNASVMEHEETDTLPDIMKINGLGIGEDEQLEVPYAVVFNNHPNAWGHQYGLSQASIIYEVLVEGGYTRYLALFQNSDADIIGPVRSARDYMIPWVQEFDAFFVHSGGSPQALQQIKSSGVKDIEEISYLGTQYFFRSKETQPPHNLFTRSDWLDDARDYLGYTAETPVAQPWNFVSETLAAQEGSITRTVSIDWGYRISPQVSYEYDKSTRTYARLVDGTPVTDALDDTPLHAKTIVIMRVPDEVVLDRIGRLAIDVTGTGDLSVISNGIRKDGIWEKESAESTTRFYDQLGNDIAFVPGQIWVEVVPESGEVVFE